MADIHLMALRHSAFYSPFLMTFAGGFLREEGLEHDYRVASPEDPVDSALVTGTCQVAQSAVATSFAGLEQGEGTALVHFAQINERDGFFIVGRQFEPDFRWADLVGKRMLVDHFFQPLAMLRYGLYRQGVEFERLQVIDAGDVEAIERAFRDGQGDYVHLQGPAAQQLEHDGVGYVVAAVGDAVGPVAFSSLCATRDWVASDMARAFMRAYRCARDYVIRAPAGEIARRAAEAGLFPSIDRDVLTRTVAAYQQLGCWHPDPTINRSAYDRLLDVFLYSGRITSRPPYEAVIVPPPDQPA